MKTFPQLLTDCGLSQKGAAYLLDVRYGTIKNWYYGRAKVPDGVMKDLGKLEDAVRQIFNN